MYNVDLHTHTIASAHAYSTINEYAQYASENQIRLFATTDHGPAMPDTPYEWHFLNFTVIPRVLYGVGVLRGVEANILANRLYPEHPLDCQDSTLEKLDIVLAGLHSPCQPPLSKKENTKMLVEAITCGRVQAITHPGNPAFPIEPKVIAKAATACNVALEVNNSSAVTRKGSKETCIELVSAQRDAGGFIIISSDAHHSHTLGNFVKALEIVAAADFPEDRIINTSPEKTLSFLRTYHAKPILELEAFFGMSHQNS